MTPAPTPRTLWIELTSRCPFDCIFCSRKLRRGTGSNLPFAVYQKLVTSLVSPRRLLLNYSGESLSYPELVPAIQLGRERGAFVELVSALAHAARDQVRALAASGLGRLTVSVHATDPDLYLDIYRHASFADLEARLTELLAAAERPTVDMAFVGMERNLHELEKVAGFAERLGIADLFLFPVMRRDPIPERFEVELRPDFRGKLEQTAAQVRERHPGLRLTMCNPMGEGLPPGEVPRPYPDPLPPDARIHTCEQNPWETAHVLANGDVVACEILDKLPLGNLHEQPIEKIWHGERYRDFRRRYLAAEVPECRTCAWKHAYRPGPLRSEILAREGASAQLVRGWHYAVREEVIWSTQIAAAVLRPRTGSTTLHLCGMLPPGPKGDPNELLIRANGAEIGRVRNPWEEIMPFGLDFPVPADTAAPWLLEFETRHVLRPYETGDYRDLGFALIAMASKRVPAQVDVSRVWKAVLATDRLGAWLRHRTARRYGRLPAPRGVPGISVVIPERHTPAELAACLESVAGQHIDEPLQVVVVVNGGLQRNYDALRRRFPQVEWRFYPRALGFNEAVRRGLRVARHEWVYLLNSDAALEAGALAALLPHRAPEVFAVASQIVLRDPTSYRDETNWTALLLEDGLVNVHDRIPERPGTLEGFYAGGGASLFQRRVLAPLVAASGAYHPFYWEDVEWGWRARKRGYRVLFCGDSVARHTRRATIATCYPPEEVESTVERNRLLFQLRNLTRTGSLEQLMGAIGHLPREQSARLQEPGLLAGSMRVRLWNHLAAFPDQTVW